MSAQSHLDYFHQLVSGVLDDQVIADTGIFKGLFAVSLTQSNRSAVVLAPSEIPYAEMCALKEQHHCHHLDIVPSLQELRGDVLLYDPHLHFETDIPFFKHLCSLASQIGAKQLLPASYRVMMAGLKQDAIDYDVKKWQDIAGFDFTPLKIFEAEHMTLRQAITCEDLLTQAFEVMLFDGDQPEKPQNIERQDVLEVMCSGALGGIALWAETDAGHDRLDRPGIERLANVTLLHQGALYKKGEHLRVRVHISDALPGHIKVSCPEHAVDMPSYAGPKTPVAETIHLSREGQLEMKILESLIDQKSLTQILSGVEALCPPKIYRTEADILRRIQRVIERMDCP